MRNIVLVGFMGTGKTSVGKVLGQRLKRPVMDIDRMIEEREGRKIAEIFEKEGEVHFRALEKEAVREAAASQGAVLTTGGGAVVDPENLARLKETGILVCLAASAETIYSRVKNSKHRPLLKEGDVLGEIKRLLEARAPFYAQADYTLQTDGQSPVYVAKVILKKLQGKY